MFAEANRRLVGDDRASFYASDLFSGANGDYDLIVFNPWQPSEDNLPVLRRFLEQLPRHLSTDGKVLLTIGGRTADGKELVLDEISSLLHAGGMRAIRRIASSHFAQGPGGALELCATSLLWIERGEARGSVIGTEASAAKIIFDARRGLVGIRRLEPSRLT